MLDEVSAHRRVGAGAKIGTHRRLPNRIAQIAVVDAEEDHLREIAAIRGLPDGVRPEYRPIRHPVDGFARRAERLKSTNRQVDVTGEYHSH